MAASGLCFGTYEVGVAQLGRPDRRDAFSHFRVNGPFRSLVEDAPGLLQLSALPGCGEQLVHHVRVEGEAQLHPLLRRAGRGGHGERQERRLSACQGLRIELRSHRGLRLGNHARERGSN